MAVDSPGFHRLLCLRYRDRGQDLLEEAHFFDCCQTGLAYQVASTL